MHDGLVAAADAAMHGESVTCATTAAGCMATSQGATLHALLASLLQTPS
jgi:hypothetical protein